MNKVNKKDPYWDPAPFSGIYKEWNELDMGQQDYFRSKFWDIQNFSKFSIAILYNYKYLIDNKGLSIARKIKRREECKLVKDIVLTKII